MLRNGHRPTYTPHAVSCKDPQILPHSTPHPSSACIRDNPSFFSLCFLVDVFLRLAVYHRPPFQALIQKTRRLMKGDEGLWPKNGKMFTALLDRSAVDCPVPRTFAKFSCCWAIWGRSDWSLFWHWVTNRIVLAYISRNIRMHAQLHGNTMAQRLCRFTEAHTHRPVDIRVP